MGCARARVLDVAAGNRPTWCRAFLGGWFEMLFGREKEIEHLRQNIQRGVHSIAYGYAGTGKTAILQRLTALCGEGTRMLYVGDCGSRRDLLRNAMSNGAKSAGTFHGMNIQALRDSLIDACRQRNTCLVLDHLPAKLSSRMQRLLESLETCSTLICGVTSGERAYDLYYWKFDAIEIGPLPKGSALSWIQTELGRMAYGDPLKREISLEVFRLSKGNAAAISRTLAVIQGQERRLEDPIQIRRMFVDGRMLGEL